jgi:hypothetical protein
VSAEHSNQHQIEVGELRERLRRLGYLDAGVDRFVLAPAQGEPSALGLASRMSIRIGLLAAVLLGPAAAVGVATRLPGLVSGPRDAIIVTLYLSVIFGAAAALASFVAAAFVTLFARRAEPRPARRIALGAGWIVGIGCLAYLTLWWNATGAVWSAPGRTLIAVAAAVGISLVLGHAVSLAALALLSRERASADLSAPALSWRTTLIVALLAFVGTVSVLAVSLVRVTRSTEPPLFPVVPTGLRIVVVGIDGFDPSLRQSLADKLPVLTSLTRRAERTPGRVDTDPARVWTTVATGMPPAAHGVSGLELRKVAGLGGTVSGGEPGRLSSAMTGVTDLLRLTRPTAISGVVRRQKMFWEVAAEHGFNAAVVNWWATWPATRTKATVISDRAPIRLERGGAQATEIAPPALYEPLRARWPAIKQQAHALASSVTDGITDRRVGEILMRSAMLDAEQVLIARDPLLGTPDLLAVYLPGLDIAQYELLQADGATIAASVLASRLDAIRRYYVFLDGLVDRLLRGGPSDVVALVTHPGRVGNAAPQIEFSGTPIDAVLVEWQPYAMASLTDVAPTVLYLLGMPVSRELRGRADHWPIKKDFAAKYPLRYVETYGAYAADVPTSEGQQLDRETLERLRSLGYIR